MNLPVKPFQELSNEEKARFFVHGQDLLVKYHPNSEFIIRKDNVTERLTHLQELLHKYQGLCYADDNICVLFNKIVVGSDKKDALAAIKDNMLRPPHPDYNGVSIDFVVFRDIKDCLAFCQSQYDPRISHVVYIKAGKPKIYKTDQLMARVFNIPKAVYV